MNIFLHELKAYRKSTMIWTVSLAALIVFFLSMFPGLTQDADQFKKLLENYPEAVRKALGVSLDSITSLLGFYSYGFTYVILCGSIQAMNLGTSILSKEVREKTADFLLTKPVTRKQIVTAKLLAVIISLVITNVIYMAIAVITASVVSEKSFDMNTFLLISLTAFLVEMMFVALGILISAAASKIKSVLPISIGTVFGFYILNMLGSVIGEKAICYLTPFKYYETSYIIKHSSYQVSFVFIEIVLIIAAIAASYVIYSKKDIHAV
ncbi:ABC transporter permease subunit [Neobacillus niacini]|uniref:ABC transporter permease subunit n=1 Tax=Neobacillus niacini TaxID=86668 RepID=UPI00285987E7|nr:ABC transporter permease subunit [Neobacillus niacini]MDR7002537.1 ABC-2 type transport system permease protein [Neobacillus niacini]